LNATHALNTAIKSLAKPGRKVLVSGFEHNAVMRPLNTLVASGVEYEVVKSPLFNPRVTADSFKTALADKNVCLAVCTHVSNVFGCILPLDEIAKSCSEAGVPLIIDAPQASGILPVRCDKLYGSIICTSGHKSLYGPQGTGLLIVPENITLKSLIEGGTGSGSLSLEMPGDLPDMLEAGTPNAWGAAGLCEGIKFVLREGVDNIMRHEHELMNLFAEHLYGIKGVKYYCFTSLQTGVMSMEFDNHDAEDIAALLSERDIAVRAGLQCAPLAHKTAGTLPYGTLRVSFSSYTTHNEVKMFAKTLREVLSG
jgi:selenocysteine lyase/cysteine desulfurase